MDKLWKGALKKAGVLEGNVKEETTGPRIYIQEKDKNLRDVFSCDFLIKMKVTHENKIRWGSEYQTLEIPDASKFRGGLEYRTQNTEHHSNTKHFNVRYWDVWFLNGLFHRCLAMEPTIQNGHFR